MRRERITEAAAVLDEETLGLLSTMMPRGETFLLTVNLRA